VQINAQLVELNREFAGMMERVQTLQPDDQNCGLTESSREHCFDQFKELSKSLVTKAESVVALLDERITLANAYPQDAVISEGKKRDTESRQQVLEGIRPIKEFLADQPR
jgi:hypothetical protein